MPLVDKKIEPLIFRHGQLFKSLKHDVWQDYTTLSEVFRIVCIFRLLWEFQAGEEISFTLKLIELLSKIALKTRYMGKSIWQTAKTSCFHTTQLSLHLVMFRKFCHYLHFNNRFQHFLFTVSHNCPLILCE